MNGIPVSGIRPPAKPAALEEILQGEIKSSLLSDTYLRLYHLLNLLVGWRAGVIIGIHHELYQLCSEVLQCKAGMLKTSQCNQCGCSPGQQACRCAHGLPGHCSMQAGAHKAWTACFAADLPALTTH